MFSLFLLVKCFFIRRDGMPFSPFNNYITLIIYVGINLLKMLKSGKFAQNLKRFSKVND